MPAIIVTLWWLLLGSLLVVCGLAILALVVIGVLAFLDAVQDIKKNMGWGAKDGK